MRVEVAVMLVFAFCIMAVSYFPGKSLSTCNPEDFLTTASGASISVLLSGWIVLSYQCYEKLDHKQLVQVVDVAGADGQIIQAAAIDGKLINLTRETGKVFSTSQVWAYKYKKTYMGLYWKVSDEYVAADPRDK